MTSNRRRITSSQAGGARDALYLQDLDQRLLVLDRGGRLTLSLDALREALGLNVPAASVTVEAEPVPVFEGAGADGLVPDPVSEGGLFLRDDGTWVAGGGGGAPTGATYVTLTTDAGLTAERTLAVGAALSLVDGGANNPVTLDRAALTGDVTAGAGSNATTIAADAVTNAKAANMANGTYKARITAGTGDPEDVSLAGTTFPASPIDGQRFYRTDLSCLFFWHATYAAWLSVNTYELDFGWASNVATNTYFYFFQGTGAARYTATNGHIFGFSVVVVGITLRSSANLTNITAQVRANGANLTNAFVSFGGTPTNKNSKENIQTSAVATTEQFITVFNTGTGTATGSGGGRIRFRRREV